MSDFVVPEVCFIDDVARALRMSPRKVRDLRARRLFPIPELPVIDKRPRWSGAVVRKFIETGQEGRALLRLVG